VNAAIFGASDSGTSGLGAGSTLGVETGGEAGVGRESLLPIGPDKEDIVRFSPFGVR